jgi:surface protein
MNAMFNGASEFNKPIGSWNTSKVTDMSSMFQNASAFNKNINYNHSVSTTAWNTSSVMYMNYMFYQASLFSEDISGWIVTNVNPKPPNFFSGGSGLTTAQLPLAFR